MSSAPDRRHVVVATDENFAMPTAVTLRSLLVHGGDGWAVTVLHNGLSIDAIDGIVAALPATDHELSWHDVSGFVHGLRLNLIEFFNWSVNEEGVAFEPFSKSETSS